MSKLTLLVHLNASSDPNSNNTPSLSNFKWSREYVGLPIVDPTSQQFTLAPGESKTLFSGVRTLLSDNTTNFSTSLKALSTNTYVLSATSGTLPNFRTPRSIGSDNTTAITVTLNGPLAIFTSTAGTMLNMATTQVGDFVRIGTSFNQLNQGEFQIISKTATSFTVVCSGVAEGPITLGASYATQIQVYSAAGVQVNDTIVLGSGFSIAAQGSYSVTSVSANSLEFYTTSALPVESGLTNPTLDIYSAAKSLVYLESDKKSTVTINGTQNVKMEPIVIGQNVKPGIFMVNATVYSLSIQNNDLNPAVAFLAAVE